MKKFLTVLLVSVVFCFTAGPVMVQAEETGVEVTEFSLSKEYSRPLVIPTVFKLEPAMLLNVKASEVETGRAHV